MDLMQPIRLLPAFKDYLWGGRRLVTDFNKKCDFDKVAESWELSTHKDGSSIISGGDFDGMLFRDYVDKYRKDVLGTNALAFDFFPILIKFIDAKDKLSVQVHPDDAYARRVEGEYGKTEMWYILDCDEGATLYYGVNKKIDKSEFLRRIKDNTVCEVLNSVPVKKGDVFFIEAGTIHAIGSGIVICEIQQNSNTTYRVYDYDRRDKNGNPRELHIEKATEVARLTPSEIKDFGCGNVLAKCKYFTVSKAEVDGETDISLDNSCFRSIIVTDGSGTLSVGSYSLPLKKGDSIFVPAQDAECRISGKCEAIISKV